MWWFRAQAELAIAFFFYFDRSDGICTTDIESKPTISDGTGGGVEKGAITFDICCDTIDQTVLLKEAEIKDAMLLYIKNERKLLEGAAGTAIAALIKKKKELAGKKVGIIKPAVR